MLGTIFRLMRCSFQALLTVPVCACISADLQLPATLQYNINLPPLPLANNALAFVALRLATYPRDRQKCDLPRALQEKFEEVFAVQAQQFKGYLFQTHEAASREVRRLEVVQPLGHDGVMKHGMLVCAGNHLNKQLFSNGITAVLSSSQTAHCTNILPITL
jgi:hypothetical protein